MCALCVRENVDVVECDDLPVEVLCAVVSEVLPNAELTVFVFILVLCVHKLHLDRSLETLGVLCLQHESV